MNPAMWHGIAEDIKDSNNKVGLTIVLFIIAVFLAPFFWALVGVTMFLESNALYGIRVEWQIWRQRRLERQVRQNLETSQYLPDDTEHDKQLRYNEAKEFLERHKK